jgi:hypothetical protein
MRYAFLEMDRKIQEIERKKPKETAARVGLRPSGVSSLKTGSLKSA